MDCDADPSLGMKILESLYGKDEYNSYDPKLDMSTLITSKKGTDDPVALLNHGAFGRAYDSCVKLSIQLRTFAEEYPDLFYDQLLMPLLKYSYEVCADFFDLKNSKNCAFLPNCTIGMKKVMDKILMRNGNASCAGKKMRLIADQDVVNVGYLTPIYGATKNLLKSYSSDFPSRIKITAITPPGALFQEDPQFILKAIEESARKIGTSFSILVCDEIASQTGRILPMSDISKYCEERNIILIVDGTQSFDLSAEKIRKVDYWIMSTHKWISNVKTCGIVLWSDQVDCPEPPAVSFGYFHDNVQDRFLWIGMLDSYISYIVLAKALCIRRQFGVRQTNYASDLLKKGLEDILQVKPLLKYTGNVQQLRLMNVFELKNVDQRWSSLIQTGKGTGKKYLRANALQTLLERVYGIHVSVKNFRGGDSSCDGEMGGNDHGINYSNSFYVRVSAYSYNTLQDFQRFHNVLYNNISITDHIKRSQIGYYSSSAITAKLPLSKLQQVIKQQFLDSFERYENLFGALETKALFIRAEKLRHHLIFYFGHTAVFYINKLISGGFLQQSQRVDPHLEAVFAIGVDEMTWDDILDENYDWCGFIDDDAKLKEYYDRVRGYRQKVKQLVTKLIEENDILRTPANSSNTDTKNASKLMNSNVKITYADQIPQDSIYWIFLMGVEHENIHLETSCSIISQVPLEYIKKEHNWSYQLYPYDTQNEKTMNVSVAQIIEKLLKKDDEHDQEELNRLPCVTIFTEDNLVPPPTPPHLLVHNHLLPVVGGTVRLGKDNLESDYFGWDNEFGTETHHLKDFEVSQTLVSNAEYLLFVKKGKGYEDSQWWTEEGWKYVTDMKVTLPRLWRSETIQGNDSSAIEGERHFYRTLLNEIPMPWSWPVEVNNLEAQAFCKWKSFVMGKDIRLLSYEENFLMRQKAVCNTANTNLCSYGSPSPVYDYHGYVNGEKIFDIYGNVWRHSVSVLTVLKGFKPHPVYEDFTLPTLDGEHNHILGGSWASLGNGAKLNSRYGFRRHFHQYAGIRYAVSSNNDYHSTIPLVIDNVMLGKEITENYTDFNNDTLPLVMNEIPKVKNWPAKFGELAADKIIQLRLGQLPKQIGARSTAATSIPLKVFVGYGTVGRVTLELLRRCKNLLLDHTDSSANKLNILDSLLNEKKIQWKQQIEGDISELLEYRLHDKEDVEHLLQKRNNKVCFKQCSDYTNMKPHFNEYDVLVADIRFSSADKQINHMAEQLKIGGIVVLATIDNLSNSCYDEHTKALKGFKLIEEGGKNIAFPHIFRETTNKHQYAISHFSCWQKISKEVTDDTSLEAKSSTDSFMSTYTLYEDQSILKSYEKLHFGNGQNGVKNFPLAIAEFCIQMVEMFSCKTDAALEAGCGPGRTSFELCKKFGKVEAFDYSENFIDSLHRHKGQFLKTSEMAEKITAYQGDAHTMKATARLRAYDLILGCNLIDRLHTPELWITQAKEMCVGLIIICSPYTWKSTHTSAEKWIGGKYVNGEKYFTVDGLKDMMAPEFSLVHHKKIVFSIPDSDGTFQYTTSNCTVFATVN